MHVLERYHNKLSAWKHFATWGKDVVTKLGCLRAYNSIVGASLPKIVGRATLYAYAIWTAVNPTFEITQLEYVHTTTTTSSIPEQQAAPVRIPFPEPAQSGHWLHGRLDPGSGCVCCSEWFSTEHHKCRGDRSNQHRIGCSRTEHLCHTLRKLSRVRSGR